MRQSFPMLLSAARGLAAHALPVLIAQLSSIGMMVVDTVVLGHVGATDLAAVAIGGGIQVSVVFALVGILQAVAPVVAQLHGARRDGEVAGVLQQGFWLAVVLAVPGVVFLRNPQWLLGLVSIDTVVADKVTAYLGLLAWGLPASLFYRTFYAFCNGLGRPRVLMGIGLASLALHALLAWGLAHQGWVGEPLGVIGCALSNVTIAWLSCLTAGAYLAFGPLGRRYRPLAGWAAPDVRRWRELLRLGLPMGLSHLIEITSFTLVSLFIAPLGATVVAGHRIIANISALTYMLALALAIATMAAVGGRDWPRARAVIEAGLLIAGLLSALVGVVLWFAATRRCRILAGGGDQSRAGGRAASAAAAPGHAGERTGPIIMNSEGDDGAGCGNI